MASIPPSDPSAITLDYGDDAATISRQDLVVCPQGLCLPARWQLQTGTEVSLRVLVEDGPDRFRSMEVRGMVVDCEPDPHREGVFRLTLWFLENPEDVATVVRALSRPAPAPGRLGNARPPVAPSPFRRFAPDCQRLSSGSFGGLGGFDGFPCPRL